jgi:hypothetical protein
VVGKLTIPLNIFHKPWLSYEFGEKICNAAIEIFTFVGPCHAWIRTHRDDIIDDMGLDPDCSEDELWEAFFAADGFSKRRIFVEFRRFFSFLFALEILDYVWTKQMLVGQWLSPRLADYIIFAGRDGDVIDLGIDTVFNEHGQEDLVGIN